MTSSRSYRLAGILVAGGRGTRFGSVTPKQFLRIGEWQIIQHALYSFEHTPRMEEFCVVVPEGWEKRTRTLVKIRSHCYGPRRVVVTGGETRQESVERGLAAIENATHVVLHDAARPYASRKLLQRVARAAVEHGAATAALPVRDTLMRESPATQGSTTAVATPSGLGFANEVVARDGLWSVQTPQAFDLDLLRKAHAEARREGRTATDDGGLVQALGHPVALVLGEWKNFKITSAEDLRNARFLWGDLLREEPE